MNLVGSLDPYSMEILDYVTSDDLLAGHFHLGIKKVELVENQVSTSPWRVFAPRR